MNVKFNEIAETVRNAFDFEVMKLPLSGADNHYTPWYGLFRDDTGDYVGSGSISERYVPHTSDDVCALVEAAANIFDGEVNFNAISRMGIMYQSLQLTTIVLLLWVQTINVSPRIYMVWIRQRIMQCKFWHIP